MRDLENPESPSTMCDKKHFIPEPCSVFGVRKTYAQEASLAFVQIASICCFILATSSLFPLPS